MNKNKRDELKRKAKNRFPEILVGATVVTAIVATLYVKQSGRLMLNVPKATLEHLVESDYGLHFHTKSGDFLLKAIPTVDV